MSPKTTLQAIDEAFVVNNADRNRPRGHMGLSSAGSLCTRALWYGFRWVKARELDARVQRLLARGDREEAWFIRLLQGAGITVHSVDSNGTQYRTSFAYGHGGGSLDAVLVNTPEFGAEAVLGEFKTHNDNSFNRLKTLGLVRAHFTHYIQMQMYMQKFNLRHGLYFAVNKNDDTLHIEPVTASPLIAERFLARIEETIFAPAPPPRIAKTPAEWTCRFCDYKEQCFSGCEPETNCRTCSMAEPTTDGGATWRCNKYSAPIPLDHQIQAHGCHITIPELLSPEAVK